MTADLFEPWNQFCNAAKDFFQWRKEIVEERFQEALNPLQVLTCMLEALRSFHHADFVAVEMHNRDNLDSVQTLIATIMQRKNLIREETHAITTDYERVLV